MRGCKRDALGGEADCEISGTGQRADLYSLFALREIWEAVARKNRGTFSLQQVVAQISRKYRPNATTLAGLGSYFSDSNDLLAEGSGSEPVIRF